jgi:uncharacterized protein with ParB-like and HNH nuclease domain
MQKTLNFEAKNKTLNEVLFGNTQHYFRIPRYQRAYAWEEEQLKEYWQDLLEEKKTYFLGSLIFNTEYREKEGYVEIIDGQQRMLTTTIFMSVLRDVSKEYEFNIKDKNKKPKAYCDVIQRQTIEFEDSYGNTTFRIMPGESIKEFFENNIQLEETNILEKQTTTKEEERVKKNYQFFYEKVKGYINQKDEREKKFERIKSLRKKAGELIAIEIRLESDDVAYEIFETVNARGVGLSVADLLKNLIFSKIKAKKEKDTAKEDWYEIERNIEETGFELKKFIRHYWMSKHDFVTEKKLYTSIKNNISDWEEFISDIKEASMWYNRIVEGTQKDFENVKGNENIFRSVFAIRLMNVSQCNVMFLSLLKNHKKINIDLSKTFKIIEKFTYQYFAICKQPGNKVEKIYSKYAIEIQNALDNSKEKHLSSNIQKALSSLKKELTDILPSKELFVEKYQSLSYGRSTKQRTLIKYSLEEVNKLKSMKNELKIDFTNVNIEHVLPQDPKKWNLTKKQVSEYVNKIGNLTLLSVSLNSSAQNEMISNKIKDLEQSELLITKELVSQLKNNNFQWDQEAIEKRQQELAELSYSQIWSIQN